VILIAVWMGSYGGFGWTDEPALQFNYHPMFMSIGIIFLYGECMCVNVFFRSFRLCSNSRVSGFPT
jgi:cytochrome b-561